MSIELPFEADTQLAEAGQPRMGTFDNPAVTTELFAALDTTTSDACRDARRFNDSRQCA